MQLYPGGMRASPVASQPCATTLDVLKPRSFAQSRAELGAIANDRTACEFLKPEMACRVPAADTSRCSQSHHCVREVPNCVVLDARPSCRGRVRYHIAGNSHAAQ